ncbi:paraquat-inducible protein A [Luteolibacter flavescens]|uniref:Paraquat-inducible protein A n=1 Tax=Luteolibacter flavescens TaxID=1859460 RepID=A0ABT3FHV6_9BACT|nr:paraquat-inducible protein A [Luteolibacter flavescens]MCW1883153.1 paraquat-inducible protein A [Luteolibacter flavescens]
MEIRSAAEQGLASCHLCGKVSPVDLGECPRCGCKLHLRKPHSLERTWSFLIAAIAFYFPANLMPIMSVGGLGGTSHDTIMSGVLNFWKKGDLLVAIIIFAASILIPILKMLALVWLCLAASGKTRTSPKNLARLYHVTELVGRWSMVDVFVVAILVSLVQVGALSSVLPGPAIVSFAAVVVLTMFAAMSFDPRLLWDQHADRDLPDTP